MAAPSPGGEDEDLMRGRYFADAGPIPARGESGLDAGPPNQPLSRAMTTCAFLAGESAARSGGAAARASQAWQWRWLRSDAAARAWRW
jgi:hypothetical protein